MIRRVGLKAILAGCLASAVATSAQAIDSTAAPTAPDAMPSPATSLAVADSAIPGPSVKEIDTASVRGQAFDSAALEAAEAAKPTKDSVAPTASPSPEAGSEDSADVPRSQTGRSVGATVTVKGVARHKRKDVSSSQLRREEFKKVAATAQDPLRALPTLPGVSTTSDLSVRPVVRGGDLTETGVQLDGTPLLMPYHFGSVFSVFHREALDDFQLHSGVAPAESEGMLSGTVLATTRPAPVDTLFGGLDLSLLRGSAWVGAPLVKDKVGLWLSGQSLWYDWVVKRGMDLGRLLGALSAKDVDQYQSLVTLPTTWDLQAGLSWKMDRNWLLDLRGFAAGDKYQIREQIDVCTVDGWEVPCPSWGDCYDPRNGEQIPCDARLKEGKGIDTVANVDLSNWLARARLSWTPDKDLEVEAVASFQDVDWDVRFPGVRSLEYDSAAKHWYVKRTSDSSVFDWTRSLGDLELTGRKRWSETQETRAGIGFGREGEEVQTRVLRPVAHLILGTTGNPLEFLGFYPQSEKTFLNDNTESWSLDDFADFRFDYGNDSSRKRYHAWVEQRWDPDPDTRVTAGVRLADDLDGGLQIPNPRLQVQRQVSERDLVGVGLGLHSQSDLPFEWRLAAETPLRSEKAWLGIAEWEHSFAPGWRSTLSGWGKLYQDLASPLLRQGEITDSNLIRDYSRGWVTVHAQDSLAKSPVAWDSSLTNQQNWDRIFGHETAVYDYFQAHIPDEVIQSIVDRYGPRHLVYASTGTGWAAGIEASLRYQPTAGWSGWASAEWSMSRRKDTEGGDWYPFGLERPWKLSWVNAFKIDRKWELSLRYMALAGNPYTPFRYGDDFPGGWAKGDTLLWIGKRNSAQLAPYQRLDLRISRESRMFGKPATFYYEIWNAFNDPNFVLRDSRTGEFRTVQLNVPFPTVFLGFEVRF